MTPDSIGLYLHIPFCTAKCGYCDFNSYAGHEHMIPSYADTLVKDAALWRDALTGRRVETVFFGGGTPSLNPVDEMAKILAGMRSTFRIAPDAEIALEANPGSITTEYLRGLREIGFNRLSIGVQSFDDEELVTLDRIHTGDEAREAFAAARDAGFENVNVDLIYGLSEQPLSAWRRNLEAALALGPEHLSLYALTVEDGTPLARDVERGRVRAPDPDVQADHYEWTQERLARAGYEHYEISNWARPDRRSRHNLKYWRREPYFGFGAGAHSFDGHTRWANIHDSARYVACIEQGISPREQVEEVTVGQALEEEFFLGLRQLEGIDWARIERDYDAELHGRISDLRNRIGSLQSQGLIELNGMRVRLSAARLSVSNEVLVELLG